MQDDASASVGGEVVSFGGFAEGHGTAGFGFELAGRETGGELGEELGAGDGIEAECVDALDAEHFSVEGAEVEGDDAIGRGGDDGEAGVGGGGFDGFGKHHAAGVEDDLCAAVVGEGADGVGDVGGFRVEDFISAILADGGDVVIGADDADDFCAFGFGDLNGGGTDGAGSAEDDGGFAGGESGDGDDGLPCGDEGEAGGGGGFHGEGGGFECDGGAGEKDEFGVGAIAGAGDVSAGAPDFAADEVGRALGDDV